MAQLQAAAFRDLVGDYWLPYLQPVLESPEMAVLFEGLREAARVDPVLPDTDWAFQAFRLCPPLELKAIFMGPAPCTDAEWEGPYRASGFPFGVGLGEEIYPVQEQFNQAMARGASYPVHGIGSFEHLAAQGVLMVNRTLTTSQYNGVDHLGKWDFFWRYFFERVVPLCVKKPPVVVLMGKPAWVCGDWVPGKCPVFTPPHPGEAVLSGKDWEDGNIFFQIDAWVSREWGRPAKVIWDAQLYALSTELPF